MLRGNWKGQVLGSGTDLWKYWAEKRAGNITDHEWNEMEGGIARSAGTLHDDGYRFDNDRDGRSVGMTFPGASSIPAVDIDQLE